MTGEAETPYPTEADAPADPHALRAELAAGTRPDALRRLLDLVRAQAAAALQVAPSELDDPRRGLADLGFASLAAVELHRRLQAHTGLALAVSLGYDHPTPQGLAEHLAALLLDGAAPARTPTRTRVEDGDPVVIVGMACRLPGGIASPDDLWRFVRDGGDAIGPFPTDRGWDVDGTYDPDPDRAGHTYVRHGGFLDGATAFDAGFFGISPREALAMDPQQRQLLETAWEVLERAGIDPLSVRGSATGVFVGAENHEYGPGWRTPGTAPRRTSSPAPRAASCPDGSRTSWACTGRPSPSTRPAPARSSPCTWPRSRCGGVSATSPWPAAWRSWPRPARSWPSAASAGSPVTGGARRSARRPTAPAGARAWPCCSSSASPTRGHAGTACSRWCAARRPTRTVRAPA
ncbi:hypothetical protein Psuf_016480 [Phytohabitans suffuscus]|uniref:Uncharacterized protein n=1 Tax=Phytohabitans suffuscus TaxID=624315 RepID=A0A6F8YDY7_9ACTN|nr:hypothetical protein Psuf_016480 [Phytohabitans suffuscus]